MFTSSPWERDRTPVTVHTMHVRSDRRPTGRHALTRNTLSLRFILSVLFSPRIFRYLKKLQCIIINDQCLLSIMRIHKEKNKFHLGIINLSKRDVYFPMPENDILLCKISPCEIYFCWEHVQINQLQKKTCPGSIMVFIKWGVDQLNHICGTETINIMVLLKCIKTFFQYQ